MARLVAVVAGVLAAGAAGLAAEPEALVDIVASTNLNTKEHAKKYAQELATGVSIALDGLDGVTYGEDDDPNDGVPAPTPKDGAAKFRILVEHRGTVSIGDRIEQLSNGHPLLDSKTEFRPDGGMAIRKVVDKSKWETSWIMKASQSGTMRFRLLEWTGLSYKELKAWNAKVNESMDEAVGGMVVVATVSQSTDGKFDRTPPCPISLAEAKKVALSKLVAPVDLSREVMAGLVQGSVKRLKAPPPPALDAGGMPRDITKIGERPEVTAEIAIENRSPWAIASVSFDFTYGEKRAPMVVTVDHTFEKPLSAGATATIKHTGQAAHMGLGPGLMREGVNITGVKYVDPRK